MSRRAVPTRTRRTGVSSSTRKPRALLMGLDPVELAHFLDYHFDEQSNYWTLYRRVRAAFLKREGETSVTVAELLDRIEDNLVEAAFRQAGFVVGFEVCRALLLGELDLKALQKNGGAR
jgi:hypothetical protein